MMQSISTRPVSAGFSTLRSSPIPTHQSEPDNEYFGLTLWGILAAAGAVALVLGGTLLLVCVGVLCYCRKKSKYNHVDNKWVNL